MVNFVIMAKEKLWLVKREVYASTIKQALVKRGHVYSIEETSTDRDKDKKKVGFTPKKK